MKQWGTQGEKNGEVWHAHLGLSMRCFVGVVVVAVVDVCFCDVVVV